MVLCGIPARRCLLAPLIHLGKLGSEIAASIFSLELGTQRVLVTLLSPILGLE